MSKPFKVVGSKRGKYISSIMYDESINEIKELLKKKKEELVSIRELK